MEDKSIILGVIFMKSIVTRRLDFSKLNFSSRIISTEEALKDVEPFKLSEEVLKGNKKIIVTRYKDKK